MRFLLLLDPNDLNFIFFEKILVWKNWLLLLENFWYKAGTLYLCFLVHSIAIAVRSSEVCIYIGQNKK